MGGNTAGGRAATDYDSLNFAFWGDSLVSGNLVTTFAASYTPARFCWDGGVGGETLAQIRARMVAANMYQDRIVIIWDKEGEVAVVDWLSDLALMVAKATSGRYLILSDIYRTDGAETAAQIASISARNAATLAAYPNNYLDVASLLTDNSTRSDGLHLTPTANANIVVPAIKQKLVDLGYMDVIA
jgi:hypothetical protein